MPRRVSGPARGGASVPAPVGPALGGVSHQPARRHAQHETSIWLALIKALESVSRHRLLDRLIRGRTWIGLVAFALIGIVTLQLGLLKLNGSIGRALEHEAVLQRENAALRIENSEMAAGGRVESQAAGIGMQVVPTSALRFLAVRPGIDVRRSAGALGTQVHSQATASEAGGPSTTATPSTESAATAEASEPAISSEPATSQSSSAPASAESPGTASAEATTAAESTSAPANSPPSVTAPASTGSAEAAQSGGAQPGSAGG